MSLTLLCSLILLACALTPSIGQTTCRGRCGVEYYRGYLCQCDYSCMAYGECCLDFEAQCTTKQTLNEATPPSSTEGHDEDNYDVPLVSPTSSAQDDSNNDIHTEAIPDDGFPNNEAPGESPNPESKSGDVTTQATLITVTPEAGSEAATVVSTTATTPSENKPTEVKSTTFDMAEEVTPTQSADVYDATTLPDSGATPQPTTAVEQVSSEPTPTLANKPEPSPTADTVPQETTSLAQTVGPTEATQAAVTPSFSATTSEPSQDSSTTPVPPEPSQDSSASSVPPEPSQEPSTTPEPPEPSQESSTTPVPPEPSQDSSASSVPPEPSTTPVPPEPSQESSTMPVPPEPSQDSSATPVTPEPPQDSSASSVPPEPPQESSTTPVPPEPSQESSTTQVPPEPSQDSYATPGPPEPPQESSTLVPAEPSQDSSASSVSPEPPQEPSKTPVPPEASQDLSTNSAPQEPTPESSDAITTSVPSELTQESSTASNTITTSVPSEPITESSRDAGSSEATIPDSTTMVPPSIQTTLSPTGPSSPPDQQNPSTSVSPVGSDLDAIETASPLPTDAPQGDSIEHSTAAEPSADPLKPTQEPTIPQSSEPTPKPQDKPNPSNPQTTTARVDKPTPKPGTVDDSRNYQADDSNDTNLCSGRPASAITTLRNGTIAVFRGHYFWFLDRNRVPGPARGITQTWGVPSPIDTVFTRCNCQGKTYIIKGNQYWRFENDHLDQGYPKAVETGFDGLRGHITAALSVPEYRRRTESVYFFKRGGLVQKYSYRPGSSSSCNKKPHYAIYTVRSRVVRQAVSLLGPTINIRTSWRGFPTTITSAVSVPTNREPEGYKYYVFSRSKSYNIRMDSDRPVIASPRGNPSAQNNNFIKCPKTL
ncbi:proteoglycan 4b isoform X2 [Dunckerocampus dactyliophorus]|uniref:proteoglycan 4b isoform X2 n=1 Tax=Dunckerocampus dactyliophorus TaxID=161453 RepID=UPI0024061594|nr:proteoglycan 4b isoform X2 [Dunckerocampus dactyliophorus]